MGSSPSEKFPPGSRYGYSPTDCLLWSYTNPTPCPVLTSGWYQVDIPELTLEGGGVNCSTLLTPLDYRPTLLLRDARYSPRLCCYQVGARVGVLRRRGVLPAHSHVMPRTDNAYAASVLRARYAMSGTNICLLYTSDAADDM
eukprot:3314838-Rhodomonas_salina.3